MHRFLAALIAAGFALIGRAGEEQELSSGEELEFFERRIRPVLADACYACHSASSEKLKGGLRLDSRASLLKGGDSGPAAVPGEPDRSLIIRAVRHTDAELQMPPRKARLPDRQVNDLVRWVQQGLPWPVEASPPPRGVVEEAGKEEAGRDAWAFRPVVQPPLPKVRQAEWVANGVDAFVLAELEARGLGPSPAASTRELIRRIYFDVLGIPPTPAEVDDFVSDSSPGVYERLIERVLARPEYGERWARHWLDVVRYAQTNGYERDGEKPFAWRYRDYVIRALNEDKPYDRFLQEQLAGDELPDATADSVAATGFQRLGVWDDEPDDALMAEYDGLDDVVSTVGTAFLGLTIGCARCHDHKFDPISQTDYYRFLAFFRNLKPNENPRFGFDSANYLPLAPPVEARAWLRQHKDAVQDLESQVACAIEGSEKAVLTARLQKLRDEKPPFEWALAVRERGAQAPQTHVLIRGNPRAPGAEVQPGFLVALGGGKPDLGRPLPDAPSTGRRLALANWITARENPLTARVAVNRAWHHLFGRGIVKSTGDFGKSGTGATHPLLLDWLAASFMEEGWSLKRLLRVILLSNTYRMSSRNENAAAQAIDPADDYLWRQRLRRLEAESLWDAALSVSGELNSKQGGRGFYPRLSGEVLAGQSRPGLDWEVSSAAEQARRSIYMFLRRTMLAPLLETFDYSNTSSPMPERTVTTVAPQALMLLNGEWARARAAALARRLGREAGLDVDRRIERGYQLAVGRGPTSRELEVGRAFLARHREARHALKPRLTFRPDAPNALFADYMRQLTPGDYLRGPRVGWEYYVGRWSAPYEGIRALDRQRGPFALWAGAQFTNGVVEATILMDTAAERGALLFRSTARNDEQRGYELAYDPREKRLQLRRHGDEVETLGEALASVESVRPLALRIEFEGARLRVWASPDRASMGLPLLDVTDAKSVPHGGVGARATGGALHFESLCVRTDGRVAELMSAPGGDALALASEEMIEEIWSAYCLMLLNLNEFAYVD